MGLKELQAWRLVKLRHQPGDRREYFEAPADVWEIFRVLAEERRRREIEPTLSMLRMALLESAANDAERHAQERMRQMHELIDRLMTWFDDVQKLAPETAMQLMGMGATVTKVLEFKDRMTGKSPAHATQRSNDHGRPSALAHAVCANISFHILFPTINIALCWLLVYFRFAARGTQAQAAPGWEEAYYFWTKVFALTFALGVVSGVTMSFQFGTNWPGFMEKAGNIAGPLLGYEVLTAFFPGGHLPGHHAVWPRPRVGPRAPGGHADGGGGHHAVGILDPEPQLVDADARGLQDH
jgi:hypothetical protein